jgi:addiction module HigA family antidote
MTNPLLKGLRPTHPGELLREDVLPALGLPKATIAKHLHISRQQLYDILDESKPITPQMAHRIGKLTRTSPELWATMQTRYDLATQVPAEIDQIPELEPA